jgi:ABC-2 type transport system ATP-binding protein
MTQKVSLAQSLVNDPQTLILDEPTSGLDPIARMELRTLLHDLQKQGKTIFFSSHELSEVELLCDSIVLLKDGKIVRQGSLAEVLGDHRELNLEKFFLEAMRGASR